MGVLAAQRGAGSCQSRHLQGVAAGQCQPPQPGGGQGPSLKKEEVGRRRGWGGDSPAGGLGFEEERPPGPESFLAPGPVQWGLGPASVTC
jgi:hypothetical protein